MTVVIFWTRVVSFVACRGGRCRFMVIMVVPVWTGRRRFAWLWWCGSFPVMITSRLDSKKEEIRLVSPHATNTYLGPKQRGRRLGPFVAFEMASLRASGDTCWRCGSGGELEGVVNSPVLNSAQPVLILSTRRASSTGTVTGLTFGPNTRRELHQY